MKKLNKSLSETSAANLADKEPTKEQAAKVSGRKHSLPIKAEVALVDSASNKTMHRGSLMFREYLLFRIGEPAGTLFKKGGDLDE